jgi:hypothetical protein
MRFFCEKSGGAFGVTVGASGGDILPKKKVGAL